MKISILLNIRMVKFLETLHTVLIAERQKPNPTCGENLKERERKEALFLFCLCCLF